jgi:hypothetical protein
MWFSATNAYTKSNSGANIYACSNAYAVKSTRFNTTGGNTGAFFNSSSNTNSFSWYMEELY